MTLRELNRALLARQGLLEPLDAPLAEAVESIGGGYRVHTNSAHDGRALSFDVDEVIAATGFTSPLRDLSRVGVATFGQSRLPAQTPFWRSATVEGIYFAGTIMQGSQGIRKHGIPSNSGAVQGYRYNARVLARHLATEKFGMAPQRRGIKPDEVVPFLLAEATRGPELWHQRSYLARVVSLDPDAGVADEGIQPLADFVDREGPDAVAMALEANGRDDPYPPEQIAYHHAAAAAAMRRIALDARGR